MGSSPLTRGKLACRSPSHLLPRLIPAHAGKTPPRRPGRGWWGAHPRSRGENSDGREAGAARRGLIPAHAGKTDFLADGVREHRAHPRSRGENQSHASEAIASRGSSPLTRGKRGRARRGCAETRLIPAHAGKTALRWRCRRGTTAHPRSRGENLAEQGWDVPALGSSPLTRGKRARRPPWRRGCRLIPAHAGKTSTWIVFDGADRGSSPLTRGKQVEALLVRVLNGLIPAHAGKTLTGPGFRNLGWAHPRSRGENAHVGWDQGAADGSSPLTRGKLCAELAYEHRGGLIPAHAGKTPASQRASKPSTAHPRSRGENVNGAASEGKSGGSSPLTRGKLGSAGWIDEVSGLIPAHAGKTGPCRAGERPGGAHPRSRGENAA